MSKNARILEMMPGSEFEIEVTQETIDEAVAAGLDGCGMMALAIRKCIPGATDIVVTHETASFTLNGIPHKSRMN